MPSVGEHDKNMRSSDRSDYQYFFLLILSGVMLLLLLMWLFSSVIRGRFRGVNSLIGNLTGQSYNCSGSVAVPKQYMPWVEEAAKIHLNGDQAALIALIQTESGWRTDAKAGSSTATGLGQFIIRTALGFKEYVGGNDGHGNNWPAPPGQVNGDLGNPDARLDPKRSIFATAHLLSGMIQRYGSLGAAYEYGYHTHGNGSPATVAAAQKARARLEQIYNTIKSGCVLSGGSFAKADGEFCPPLGSHQATANYKQHGGGIFSSTVGFPTPTRGAIDWGQACNCGRAGYPVYATFNGVVSKMVSNFVSESGGNRVAGDYVQIVSDDKKNEALYAHIDASVSRGQKVSKCQQIGVVAGYPKSKIDTHLHFQFWYNSKGLTSLQLYQFFRPKNNDS